MKDSFDIAKNLLSVSPFLERLHAVAMCRTGTLQTHDYFVFVLYRCQQIKEKLFLCTIEAFSSREIKHCCALHAHTSNINLIFRNGEHT